MRILVDRNNETNELLSLSRTGKPEMALLYGRRRVGKSFLLGNIWNNPFYFLAADTTSETNRNDLLNEFEQWSGNKLNTEDYPTWRSVFRLIFQTQNANGQSPVLILDEFQYLLAHKDNIVSQLTAIWDRELNSSSMLLVLCGSEVSTMEALQSADSPVFGRLSWSSRLRSFDYYDSSKMLPWLSLRELVYFYGALGGLPRFLSAVKQGENLRESLYRILLSTRGEVHIQLQNIISSEKGIRNTAEYDAVLRAIASGRRQLGEISSTAGLQGKVHTARRALEVLENLDFICRERNYGAAPKVPWRYRIADNSLRFWHRFIETNRSRLERDLIDNVWETSILPSLDIYTGFIFEDMARQALLRFNENLHLPVIKTCARWEGKDRYKRSIEIDLVGVFSNGEMLSGEVKWSSSPIDPEIHFHLRRDLEDLAASGVNWANHALNGKFIYFSAGGFSEYMKQLARENPSITLVTLADMFPVQ